MFRVLNKNGLVIVFLLAISASCLAFFGTHSRAAEFSQSSSAAVARLGSFGAPASPADAVDDVDDVKVVITTNRDGNVYTKTSSAKRPRSNGVSVDELAPIGNVPAAAGDIVFSQIYSNGGNAGSTFQNNYLELFNRTDNAIDFDGWRIYFTSANGSFDQSISFTSSRQIFIGAHSYLLIRWGPDSANGASVPADLFVPFVAPPIPGVPPPNISPSGKVFLTMPNVNAFGNTCPPNSQIV